MIEKKTLKHLTEEWIKDNIHDPTNTFAILRKIIPWQKITDKLVHYYNDKTGRTGTPIRTIIAVFIAARLRLLSDRAIVSQVKENRYIQYFCNVPDENLFTFMHHSNLSKLRKRFGIKGIETVESIIFNILMSCQNN